MWAVPKKNVLILEIYGDRYLLSCFFSFKDQS